MTSNPQSRRPNLVEVSSDPTITPYLLRQIDDKIRQHEIRMALYGTLLAAPILSYILLKLNHLSSLLNT